MSVRHPLRVAVLAGALALYLVAVIAAPTWLTWTLLAVPVLLVVVAWPLIYWGSNRLIEQWFWAVFGLVSGDRDYATLSRSEALALLERRWEHLSHSTRLIKALDRSVLQAITKSSPDTGDARGYSLVLVMILARLGYAAEYLTQKETFGYCLRALRLIQASYTSWEALGQAVDQEWRRDMEARPDVHAVDHAEGTSELDDVDTVSRNIVYLRAHVWPRVTFERTI